MSSITVILLVLGTVEQAWSLGSMPFGVLVNPLFANCSTETRRAGVLCPCILLPSTNRGVPIPCGAVGSACLPYDPSLRSFGVTFISSSVGNCQCTSGFTRNSTSNTCSANLKVTVTPYPNYAFVPCNVLAGQLAIFNITITGGVAPYTVTSLTVFSSGDFPGSPQNAPRYLDLDPNNKLRVVPTRNAPDLDVTQCYTLTVTDAASSVASIIFCADIETPNICPRPLVGLTGILTTSPIVPVNQPLDRPIGKLTVYGGVPPYTFTTPPTTVSCVGEVPLGGDPGSCNPFTVLSSDGTISLNSAIPNLPLSDTIDCLTAKVTDSSAKTGTANYCVTIKAS